MTDRRVNDGRTDGFAHGKIMLLSHNITIEGLASWLMLEEIA